ncbi:MAG TPA: hypothetical protein PLD62_06035 [Candidatus Cloacimonadota bacterium]|nr:hypothetical protein [Candidatus Cloacimonadota bacterium]
MKRVFLFVFVIALVSGIYAHEVTANLSLSDNEDRGFKFMRGDLCWGNENYSVDLDFKYLNEATDGSKLDFNLSQAWKKVNLWDFADLSIGKQTVTFGSVLSSKGSANLQIQKLHVAPTGWMFKIHKNINKINMYADGIWPGYGTADVGGRLAYESDLFTLGGSATACEIGSYFSSGGDDDISWAYEGDLKFVLANFLKLHGQFTNLKDSGEINFFVVASYAPGFEFPYLGKKIGRVIYGDWRPYVGIITRDDAKGDGMGENNIFGGLNYQSYENSYMKFEVNIDSDDDIDPSLLVQLGYKF